MTIQYKKVGFTEDNFRSLGPIYVSYRLLNISVMNIMNLQSTFTIISLICFFNTSTFTATCLTKGGKLQLMRCDSKIHTFESIYYD